MIAEALGLPSPDALPEGDTRDEVLATLREEIVKLARSCEFRLADVLALSAIEREMLADARQQIADERAIILGRAIRGEIAQVLARYDGGEALVDEALEDMLDVVEERENERLASAQADQIRARAGRLARR